MKIFPIKQSKNLCKILAELRRSVLRVSGAHLRVIAPRQHSYLLRCWSGGE